MSPTPFRARISNRSPHVTAMRPLFKVLDDALIARIIDEAMALLEDPGVQVHNDDALRLLAAGGAAVRPRRTRWRGFPKRWCAAPWRPSPGAFDCTRWTGNPRSTTAATTCTSTRARPHSPILDSETGDERAPRTADLVDFVKLVETLPALDAQSTSMICADVPAEIGDLYRLYLVLSYGRKPVVTGAFRKDTWWTMKEMLVAVAGSEAALAAKPIAIFDVCPSPPLLWSDLTCQNLIDCARTGIPAELVSMPLAGATAPVTLAAAVVQHAAECLSGIVIGQLARPGAAIVWGGSPAAFDMREGTTPMGDVGNVADRLRVRGGGQVAGAADARVSRHERRQDARRRSAGSSRPAARCSGRWPAST